MAKRDNDTKSPLDKTSLNDKQKSVMDWMARQPAKVFHFADVHEGLGSGPSVNTEAVVVSLRNPDLEHHLSEVGPDGKPVAIFRAYLPPNAPIRASYPPLTHPPVTAALPPVPAAKKVPPAVQRAQHDAAEEARVLAERARNKERKQATDALIVKIAADEKIKRIERARAHEEAVNALFTPPQKPTITLVADEEEEPKNAG